MRLVVTDAYTDHKLGLLEAFPVHMRYIRDFLKEKNSHYMLTVHTIFMVHNSIKSPKEKVESFFDRSLALKCM